MDFEKNGRIWRTMIGADMSACMDYADDFSKDGQRGPAWLAAFQSRAMNMGYRIAPEALAACKCGRQHRADCGYARPTVNTVVIPFDGGDVDRLPSITAPAAPVDVMPPAPPWKPLAKPRPHFRPKDTGKLFNSLPGDAFAGIPESDPDFAFDVS